MKKNLYGITNEDINETLLPIEEISKKDIAIIGIAVKMPMADNMDQFWDNLRKGTDSITDFPELRRTDADKYLLLKGRAKEQLKYYQGAFLHDIDKFDYKFFKISPKEASLMDPTQRLFLETVWQAIEDAGYGNRMIRGSKTGTYLGFEGSILNTYAMMIHDVEHSSLPMSVAGNTPAIIPSRISYLLDLKGPTMIVDTACSSSLVAIHLACQGIQSGDCKMAIAGGIKIFLFPIDDPEEKIGIESSDFKTKTFDERSDGTGHGEGVAAILLKPLISALKDQDHIYAVIKGSAINQDGNSASLTAPNALSQAEVIEQAWEKAGIDPETISYIEAHGTGTKIGDPIEIDGIQKAFKRYTNKKQFCSIGSVKTNVGHLFEASGIVGLIKAALALKYRELPPTIHFKIPNKKISFAESPVYVLDRLVPWETQGYPRRCGVNAFGFSGTNCHIILEEAPSRFENKKNVTEDLDYVFTLSAKSYSALKELLKKYRAYFNQAEHAGMKELCCTTNTGRDHFNLRLAIIVRSYLELKEKINRLVEVEIITAIPEEGVYFGEFKTVSHQPNKGENEISEALIEELTMESMEKTRCFLDSGKTNRKLLAEICELYVQGANVPWESFYQGEKIQKVKLPVYPFDQTRCWLEIPDAYPKFEETGINYTIVWEREELGSVESNLGNENTVIFLDTLPSPIMDEESFAFLRKKSHAFFEVEVGLEYQKNAEDKYAIRNREEDYVTVLNQLKVKGLTSIIHVLSLKNNQTVNSLDELEENLNRGCYSLFFLAKAIQKVFLKEEIRLFLVSYCANQVTGRERMIQPANASFLGLGKIIERENPQIQYKGIDIDDSVKLDQISREFFHDPMHSQVAYRNGERYIEVFTEIDPAAYPSNEPIAIKDKGVYVITGGAGGIGLEVAKYLASKNKVNLAFINRSQLPKREKWPETLNSNRDPKLINKINSIMEIEKNGSQVVYYRADIGNRVEIEEILIELRGKYETINGVIHAAGLPGEGFLANKSELEFTKVLRPKIQGTWILEKLTQDDNLDFFIMFSSVATIFGAPGQSDYTAANSYLDAFASLMNQKGRKALAIDWVQWLEIGMAVESKLNVNTIFKALSNQQGILAFEELLKTNLRRVLVGEINYQNEMVLLLERTPIRLSAKITRNLENQKGLFGAKVKHHGEKQVGQVILQGRGQGDYTDMERIVAQTWGEILGYNKLNIDDKFYELGGDSILAIKICNRVNMLINRNLNIAEFLDFSTIRELAQYLQKINADDENIYSTLKPVEKREYYPLSSAQKRLFVLYQLSPESINYNLPEIFIMKNGFDRQRFSNAIHQLIERHEALRTSFQTLDNEAVQIIHDQVEFKIDYFELNENETHESYMEKMRHEFCKPFDLGKAPLLKIAAVRLNEKEYMLLFDKHHIIWDAMTSTIFVREFLRLFAGETLPDIKLQYKDYSVWQDELKNSSFLQEQEAFWLNLFAGEIPVLNLPADYSRLNARTQQGDRVYFQADAVVTTALNKIATESETTIYTILLASFYILLGKYSCQEDIVIGSPVLGRSYQELENTIGLFVNTVALRNFPGGNKLVIDFIREVKSNVLKAFENQDMQFEELIEKLQIKRIPNRNPLFDVMFVLQNVTVPQVENFEVYVFENKTSKFDLTLEANEFDNIIKLHFEYSTDLFKRESIDRMSKDYLKILETLMDHPEIRIKEIKLENQFIKEEVVLTEDIEFDF